MASKGIDFRYFKTKGFSFEIVKRDPGEDYQRHFTDDSFGYFSRHEELNGLAGIFGTGYFQFFAKRDNINLYERSIQVTIATGNIDDTDLENMNVAPVIENNYCLSFGLYDADGALTSGLPNSHQVWACLTQNQTRWQERLFKELGNKPVLLKNMILPGSHDAGMYLNTLTIVSNLANTQKNDIKTQLQLGARFFDFRPGQLRADFMEGIKRADGNILEFFKNLGLSSLALLLQVYVGEMRHIHGFIPGAKFEDFIKQTVEFLKANPSEIVVVKISSDGIDSLCSDIPSKQKVNEQIASLIAGSEVKTGDKSSLNETTQSLIASNKRLIILHQDDLFILSSYDENKYKHYEASYIIDAFKEVKKDIQSGSASSKDLIDFQAQLTATLSTGAVFRALAGLNSSTSPLRATKARADEQSYPWLLDYLKDVPMNLPLLTIINDFYDNALTEIVYLANKARLSK
jgi:hypothetical protein